MAQNCPYYQYGKCNNPDAPMQHNCSYPSYEYQNCNVYVLITDPVRGRQNVINLFTSSSNPENIYQSQSNLSQIANNENVKTDNTLPQNHTPIWPAKLATSIAGLIWIFGFGGGILPLLFCCIILVPSFTILFLIVTEFGEE
jgi:hypothetical protein